MPPSSSPPDRVYGVLRELRALTDAVLVSYSGGKDSAAVLDLCVRGAPAAGIEPFRVVQPFFLYQIPGLEFQQRVLRQAEARYGLSVLQYPHPDLTVWLRHGTYRHAPDYSVRRLKFPEVWRAIRNDTGLEWVLGGERAGDSLWRLALMKRDGAIQPRSHRAFPVAFWSKDEVRLYVRHHRLPLSVETGSAGNLSCLRPYALHTLRRHYPDDFQRVLEMFPFAEVAVALYEDQLQRAIHDSHQAPQAADRHQAPAVPDRDAQPRGPQERAV